MGENVFSGWHFSYQAALQAWSPIGGMSTMCIRKEYKVSGPRPHLEFMSPPVLHMPTRVWEPQGYPLLQEIQYCQSGLVSQCQL
jgi:hypothetical protein